MRVIFNTSNFPARRGDSTTPFIFDLAQSVIMRGISVEVIAPHAYGAKKNEVWNKVAISRFQYFWPARFQTLFATGGALSSLRVNKANYLQIPFLLFFQIVSILHRVLKNKYNIVHSHWILPQGLTGLIVSKICNLPHIVHIHGADLYTFNSTVLTILKKWVLVNSDLIIVNSPMVMEELSNRYKGLEPKILVIPTPLNSSFCNFLEGPVQQLKSLQNKQKSRKFKFLFVGRLVEEKGVLDVIRGFAEFIVGKNQCYLTIVGDGPLMDDAVALATKLNCKGSVLFKGWLSGRALSSAYHESDVFIGLSKVSSEGWKEAMGLTYVEALACGLTVICTKNLGFLSLLEDDYIKAHIVSVSSTSPRIVAKALHKAYSKSRISPKFEANRLVQFTQRSVGNALVTAYVRLCASTKQYSP